MKGLVASFCFIVSFGAYAQFGNNCSYRLLDEYNREIMTVDDYTCNDALLKCEKERDYQVYNNLIRQGTCEQVGGNNGGGYNGGGYNGGGYNGGGYNGGGYGQCEVSLQNSMGMTYQVFNASNCGQALANCEQVRIIRQTPFEPLICRTTSAGGSNGGYNGGGYPGGGYGQSVQCIFSLTDVRTQREVNQFMQMGSNQQQACELAYNQCQSQARAYNGYSGVQNYVCSRRAVNYNGGNNGGYNGGNQGQYSSQNCTVAIVDTRGSILERTIGTASGYGQMQVRQQACIQAQNQCRNIIAARTVPNRPSPYFGARCIQQ
jgi:hypothetical protein